MDELRCPHGRRNPELNCTPCLRHEIDRLRTELERLRGEREEEYVRGYVKGRMDALPNGIAGDVRQMMQAGYRAEARRRLAGENESCQGHS